MGFIVSLNLRIRWQCSSGIHGEVRARKIIGGTSLKWTWFKIPKWLRLLIKKEGGLKAGSWRKTALKGCEETGSRQRGPRAAWKLREKGVEGGQRASLTKSQQGKDCAEGTGLPTSRAVVIERRWRKWGARSEEVGERGRQGRKTTYLYCSFNFCQ